MKLFFFNIIGVASFGGRTSCRGALSHFFWGGGAGYTWGMPKGIRTWGPGGENDSATAMDLNGED